MSRLLALHRQLVTTGPAGLAQQMFFSLLRVAGCLYGLIGRLRRKLYRTGVLSVYRAPVPVISVGNLTVGGTGKTPMVDYLVKWLQGRGRRVAVVSRGYGGQGAGRVGVVCAGEGPLLPPEVCGDEPYLLAQRNHRALVLVAPRRAEGIRLAVERYAADVILLDDGFQHLPVARDLDIMLLDARRPFGNGHLLPAGLLRESPAALSRAGAVVLTRSDGTENPGTNLTCPLIRCRHRLAVEAVSLSGENLPLINLAGQRGVAFAGIADPDNYFAALAAQGLHLVRTLPLADHVAYDRDTLALLADAARDADFLVITEKDGVKLSTAQLPLPCYQTPVALEFYDQGSLHLERALNAVIPQETP
jgi:tetraacyldisaccharide 4'-kinase